MLDRADCADFGCHNSIRLETKHILNTLALTFISFSGRFVFAMQNIIFFFCEPSSSFYFTLCNIRTNVRLDFFSIDNLCRVLVVIYVKVIPVCILSSNLNSNWDKI